MMVAEGFQQVILYIGYAMAVLAFLIIAYVVMTYRETTRALRLYADHIKATMGLREVQQFIQSYRKPKIEVIEDPKGKLVYIRWYIKEFSKDKPSVLVHVDLKTKKPIKVEVH